VHQLHRAQGCEAGGEDGAQRRRVAGGHGRQDGGVPRQQGEAVGEQGATVAAAAPVGRYLVGELRQAGDAVRQHQQPAVVTVDADVRPPVSRVPRARMVLQRRGAGEPPSAGAAGPEQHVQALHLAAVAGHQRQQRGERGAAEAVGAGGQHGVEGERRGDHRVAGEDDDRFHAVLPRRHDDDAAVGGGEPAADGVGQHLGESPGGHRGTMPRRAAPPPRRRGKLPGVTGDVVVLWRPTGPEELALVEASGWRRWPPRLEHQPIFYPVLNREYATKIARDWNVPHSGVGYVTRFEVSKPFLDRYDVQQAGGSTILEYWIPAEDLDEFNDHIVGLIEVVDEYR
jgi:hypothetical protein